MLFRSCGADVTAPGETHHHVAAAAAMCALLPSLYTEATLKRPGGPHEELGLTSLRRKVSPQGRAALLASPGDSRHLAARERRFSAASPGAGAWDLWDFHPHPYWANGGQVHGDPSSHWADSSPRAHDGHA